MYGQSDQWVELNRSTGFFIPHRVALPQLQTDHAKGISLNYSRSVSGEEDWHHIFAGPRKGLGLFVLDMGNKEELGNIYSLYPYLDLPMDRYRNSELFLHLGVGIAYLDKRYDFDDNFFNTAIGSHVNYSIVIGLRYRYLIGRWSLGVGMNMTHASNAAIQLPNLGVNLASADLSIGYRLNAQEVTFEPEESRIRERKEKMLIGIASGFRESNPVTREKHAVQEIRFIYNREFSPKLSYQIGADLIHNKASYQELEDVPDFGLDVLQAGLKIGIAMDLGRSQLFFQNGFYLSDGYQEQGFLYHRFGGRMNCSDRISLDLSLKTHYAKADYLALGIAYKLTEKNIEPDARN